MELLLILLNMLPGKHKSEMIVNPSLIEEFDPSHPIPANIK